MSVFSKVNPKKIAEQVKKEVEKQLKDVYYRLKRDLESAGKTVEKQVIGNIGNAAQKLPKEAEKLVKKAFDDITSAFAREGLKKALSSVKKARVEMEKLEKSRPQLTAAINGLGFSLQLGPVTLSYNDFYSKAIGIEKSLEDLTKKKVTIKRSTIIRIVDALAPDSINLGIDVDLAALVVSSDALSVGFSLDSISTDLGLELLDVILKEIGVPE